jgi:RNA polymerase sigma factor (sigma-70 family)
LHVKHVEIERPFESQALREIERSLHSKLRVHRLSNAFIDRYSDDALQRGLVEYLRAIEAGASIQNRDAFVVDAAFKRAVDELRRESRSADAATLEQIVGAADEPAASDTEEVVLGFVLAEELHRAIAGLAPEERQVLRLYYFDRLSAERAAELMHLSERTYRRRLGQCIEALSKALGVDPPAPDSVPGLHVGLAAWIALRGTDVVPRRTTLAEHVVGVLERVRHRGSSSLDRATDLAARTTASGNAERLTAIASGPTGKIAGGCAGAAIICVLAGVVGPGVQIGGSAPHQTPARGQSHRVGPAPRPSPPARTPKSQLHELTTHTEPATKGQPRPASKRHASSRIIRSAPTAKERARHKAAKETAEAEQVEKQTSAAKRVAVEAEEAEAETAPAVTAAVPTESPPPEVVVEPEPEPAAPVEKKEAEKQFGGPFHR